MDNEKGLILSPLDEVFKKSMIAYAEDVIMDRALPRVEDGLKPVQRRILFDMYEQGLTPEKPHRKCAKIVGDVLGKFHPHGDSSVYGALVHLVQDFNMRMPLIDGHGNFGTVDGDGAAAYRYTEAKLKPLALELLDGIEEDTVNMRLNFDDTIMEPDTLPGRFPNLLVNGAMGIAVGLATNIPPHNLTEVINGTIAYIENPKISLNEMMKYIPAPDFPTGGYIVVSPELKEAYKTGKGKIRIKSRVNVEKDTGDKSCLVISEIPYYINKSELLKKISELAEAKKGLAEFISGVVDESDRNGMRAVVKLKKEADPKAVLQFLYKNTQLEISFGINMVAIAHGKPCQLGLLDIIGYYVNYQREVILRRSKFQLERAKERAHILEGLIVAVKNIDEVIKIIKKAENTADARVKLMERFTLSERQANAILDLKLARLTKLEVTKLEQELADLKKLIAELTAIIASKAKQMDIVKKELLVIRKKYGDDRRSKLIDVEDVMSQESQISIARPVEDFVVAVSEGGLIKKMTDHNFKVSDRKVKENANPSDFIKDYVETRSDKIIYAFTNLGNVCTFAVDDIPECRFRDKGVKLSELSPDVKRNEKVVSLFAVDGKDKLPEGCLLFYTKEGLVKKTEWAEYNLLKNFYQAIKLKDEDELLGVQNDFTETTIVYVTKKGIGLNAEKSDIPLQGRVAGGVRVINLNKGDDIVFVSQIDDEGEIVVISDAGYYKRVLAFEIEVSARNRKGNKICELPKDAKVVFASYVKNSYNIAVIDNFGVAFTINTEELSVETRSHKGKQLKNENKKRMPEFAFIVH